MAEQKTKPTTQTPQTFLDTIADENVCNDCYKLINIMEEASGEPATMWGTAIIGFGKYNYKYASGHEGYSCLAGFSPRKNNIITLYIMGGTESNDLLAKFGKYKAGKGCIYIKKLQDIDNDILKKLIERSCNLLKEKYPA
ncbi:DUF1801 domain-containing protein [Mucilaginibacter segetis]|uniref:DUF1801 domain-containing protein n=1 Tax=Mucilaginibacter segetis TaxID=2793071 RepID=A0A934ULH1_9SPHI|nr:DUF1801 domain-containing protein [Mucilaginibacter segetis]MBK0378339.1 DUF1801 domain-containing protein [Mucilaginibacter segetis]